MWNVYCTQNTKKVGLFEYKKNFYAMLYPHCLIKIESAMEKKYNKGFAKECTIKLLMVAIAL